ncbi:uncharacterized protein LOC123529945 [Mercenaria mercenaria]|uniref:uncharacterized protein LOC123529945 n=1 Tax=Mercenaria mercenaria TaxID=6596 RepID=UPI00234F47D3|nr:uncharacterized protein LOC123529945 [Mercenaria mercenaria]
MDANIDERVEQKLREHRSSLLTDMEKIITKISDNNAQKFSNLLNAGIPKFKRKSNEEQYKYNSKVGVALDEAESLLSDEKTDECSRKIAEAKDLVLHRQKLIRLADNSELGWRVVHEYECNPLADNSDDEKRMMQAESRANRKFKAEKKRSTRRSWPYRRPTSTVTAPQATVASTTPTQPRRPGLCFDCGKPGHWKGAPECAAKASNNKMSINLLCTLDQKNDGQSKIMGPEEPTETLSPVGRLKEKYHKWKEATGSDYILNVIDKGYKLPFKTIPEGTILKNNRSARENVSFVEQEIQDLLDKGIISKSEKTPKVVNPLTVAINKKGKKRLVLDCRYINPHLHQFKIKFEDIKIAEKLFEKNSFLFTYDLKGAYHHIDIFYEHRTYLGFSFPENGSKKYYVFNSLPFGIKTAGHIFTKLLRIVVSYLRCKGHKIIMFLDDGIGGHNSLMNAITSSDYTKQTFIDFGFLLAHEKCEWVPKQKVTWLGHVLDVEHNLLFITENRIRGLESSIESLLYQVSISKHKLVPVRYLASVVGQITSVQSVIGNKVRLLTRYLFNCINSRASWNAPVMITENAIDELQYWRQNVRSLNKNGKNIDKKEICMYNVFADARQLGYGGYVELNNSQCPSKNTLGDDVMGRRKSQGFDNQSDVYCKHDAQAGNVFSEIEYKDDSLSPEADIISNSGVFGGVNADHVFPEVNTILESPEVDSGIVPNRCTFPEVDKISNMITSEKVDYKHLHQRESFNTKSEVQM